MPAVKLTPLFIYFSGDTEGDECDELRSVISSLAAQEGGAV
jgi:hypothetical protein